MSDYIKILLDELKYVFSSKDVIEFRGSSLSTLIDNIEQQQQTIKELREALSEAAFHFRDLGHTGKAEYCEALAAQHIKTENPIGESLAKAISEQGC